MSTGALFNSIKFIADNINDESLLPLVEGGATQFRSFAEVPGASPIHLITEDYNSPLSLAAQSPPYSGRTLICTPAWIAATVAKCKIQDVRRFSADPRQFFTGVCVTCSELPAGDKEAIYGGVLALGGQFSDALVKGTTHVVALTTASEKVIEVLARPQSGIEVVLPHWFDDCLRLRRRIPSEPYRFPHPRILQNCANLGPPPATSQDSDYRYLCDSRSLTEETPETEENIFDGKRILLGTDLELGDRLLRTISAVLGGANGRLASNMADADIYIGKYRDGTQFMTAARTNKIVGNYTWILYCLARGKYSSPRSHLLHYPLARGGMMAFRKDVITVSNYTGEARLYLERLITALGAKFTRNMKPENTHLITAAESGEKYNTAKQWGISCVNHLWLEESYAQWHKQAVTSCHYVTFPRETNLMDIIAQTAVLKEGIEPFYLEDETEDEDEPVKAATEIVQQPVTELPQVGRDINAEQESQDIELPDIKDVRQFSSPLPSNNNSKAERLPHGSTPKNEALVVSGPPVSKSVSHSPENKNAIRTNSNTEIGTPTRTHNHAISSRGSTARKASQQAASKLKHDMEDANKFGQQMRNKHKLPLLPSEMLPSLKKRKEKESSPAPMATMSGNTIKIVMTGCPELTEDLHTKCEEMGIEIVESPENASHLVAPRIARTKKFVIAIAKCEHFVHWDWLAASVKAQKLVLETDFPPDAAPAAPWSRGLNFAEVLKRAKAYRKSGGFLKGFTILVSDAVTKIGGFETYRDIVEVNGGVCGLVGRRGTECAGRTIMIAEGKADPAIAKYLSAYSGKAGAKDKENRLGRQKGEPEIYDREWLMMCAIRQEVVQPGKLKLN